MIAQFQNPNFNLSGYFFITTLLCIFGCNQSHKSEASQEFQVIPPDTVVYKRDSSRTPPQKKFSVWSEPYYSRIPVLNVHRIRIVHTADSNPQRLLQRMIPGFLYGNRNRLYSNPANPAEKTLAWKSFLTSTAQLSDNRMVGQSRVPFQKGSVYFTSLNGSADFTFRGIRHRAIAFNTMDDEMGAGRLVGGLLGIAVFSRSDTAWNLAYFNPALGYFGHWQSSPMPEIRAVSDSLVVFEIKDDVCYGPGRGACYSHLEFWEYRSSTLRKIAEIRKTYYLAVSNLSHWESQTMTVDTASSISIITSGWFAPEQSARDWEISEEFGPKTLWNFYRRRKNQNFNFEWIRELRYENGKWRFSDRGCTTSTKLRVYSEEQVPPLK